MNRRRLLPSSCSSQSLARYFWTASHSKRNGAAVGNTKSHTTHRTTSHSILLAVGLSGCLWATSSATTRLDANVRTSHTLSATPTTPALPHTLFVWDFDWTVINCNSDEYIPAQFMNRETLTQAFKDLYKSTGGDWHACVEGVVNRVMMAAEGGAAASPSSLLEAAQQMPYLLGVRQALDLIDSRRGHHNKGTTAQMILSDGNTLFIEAFLQKEGLVGHFPYGIISNEGQWDENGRLRVIHHSQQYGGHGCDRCSANLCKTQALQKTLAAQHDGDNSLHLQENDNDDNKEAAIVRWRPRIVYVGDGANDACPVLNVLREGDVMLARVGRKRNCANDRKGPETDEEATSPTTTTNNANEKEKEGIPFGIVPALQRAKESGVVPQCQVLEWQTGDELRQLVEKLLDDIK